MAKTSTNLREGQQIKLVSNISVPMNFMKKRSSINQFNKSIAADSVYTFSSLDQRERRYVIFAIGGGEQVVRRVALVLCSFYHRS